jgi:hypothetical protein
VYLQLLLLGACTRLLVLLLQGMLLESLTLLLHGC